MPGHTNLDIASPKHSDLQKAFPQSSSESPTSSASGSGPTFTLSSTANSSATSLPAHGKRDWEGAVLLGSGHRYHPGQLHAVVQRCGAKGWTATVLKAWLDLNDSGTLRYVSHGKITKELSERKKNPDGYPKGTLPGWVDPDFDFEPPKYRFPTPDERQALARLLRENRSATIDQFERLAIEHGAVQPDPVQQVEGACGQAGSQTARLFHAESESRRKTDDLTTPRYVSTRQMASLVEKARVTEASELGADSDAVIAGNSLNIGRKLTKWPRCFPDSAPDRARIIEVMRVSVRDGWSKTQLIAAIRMLYPHLALPESAITGARNFVWLRDRATPQSELEQNGPLPFMAAPELPEWNERHEINRAVGDRKFTPSQFSAFAATALQDIDARKALTYFMGGYPLSENRLPEPVSDASATSQRAQGHKRKSPEDPATPSSPATRDSEGSLLEHGTIIIELDSGRFSAEDDSASDVPAQGHDETPGKVPPITISSRNIRPFFVRRGELAEKPPEVSQEVPQDRLTLLATLAAQMDPMDTSEPGPLDLSRQKDTFV